MNSVEITPLELDRIHSSDSNWRDSVGIIASIGCAIHCAAMPFVVAYLPALGLNFLLDESFHKWMALVCFLIAIAAFIPGIRKHRNWLPVSIGGCGLIFITFAAFGLAGECCPTCEAAAGSAGNSTAHQSVGAATGCDECDECASCDSEAADLKAAFISEAGKEKDLLSTLAPWITPIGGLLLVAAHLLNRRFGFLCGCCETPATA